VIAPDLDLHALARSAAEHAYVPYCRFPVGAAVRFDDGHVASGANIDNASYPVTGCAERSAISAGVSAGRRRIVAVAVHGPADSVAPCGACRQLISEFAADDCAVTFPWQGELIALPFGDLLPFSFRFDGPNP
jgi:cytidine deaminase